MIYQFLNLCTNKFAQNTENKHNLMIQNQAKFFNHHNKEMEGDNHKIQLHQHN